VEEEGEPPVVATRRPSRPTLALIALCTAAAATTAVVIPATAEPRPSIAAVERQVAALEERAEHAAERYNDLRVQIADVERGLARTRANVAKSQRRVDATRRLMGQLARTSYQTGSVDPTVQLLLSGDPASMLDRASSLDQLAKTQSTALDKVVAARNSLAQDTAALDSQLVALRDLQERAAREKRAMDDSVAAAQRVLSTLRVEERAKLAAAERARREAATRASRSERRRIAEEEPVFTGPASGRARKAVEVALAQVGDSYVYAADGPDAFDCSGLTTFAWRAAGVSLPRSSRAQHAAGRKVSRSDLQPGDLVYFYSPISHVGIYIGDGKMVHAANPRDDVRVDPISLMPYSGATRP
jgi:cell wall-associated NlpC family hydrolase